MNFKAIILTVVLLGCATPQPSTQQLENVKKVRAIVGNVKEKTVLLGLTRDAHKWGTPGGAIESGEDLKTAVLREVFEETGLESSTITGMKLLQHDVTRKTSVFGICVNPAATQSITTAGDKDKEFSELAWFKLDAFPDNTYPDAIERAKLFFAENEKSNFCGNELALTIDDLPFVKGETFTPELEAQHFESILATLKKYRVTAVGFANGVSVKGHHHRLLQNFIDNGHILGNHTFSHKDYHKVDFPEFRDDVLAGLAAIEPWLRTSKAYFRHPYLHHGNTAEKKASLDELLRTSGHIMVPVTIDDDDWLYNQQYMEAIKTGNSALAAKIGEEYLTHMREETQRNQKLAHQKLGRDVKHILIIHMNLINTHYLDKLLGWYQDSGWSFITTEQALSDPVYQKADTYVGEYGWSWLRRW